MCTVAPLKFFERNARMKITNVEYVSTFFITFSAFAACVDYLNSTGVFSDEAVLSVVSDTASEQNYKSLKPVFHAKLLQS